DLAAELSASLPNGHEKNIAATLLHSVKRTREPARDLLRLASLLAAAPIPETMALVILGHASQMDPQPARTNFRLAAADVNRFALGHRQGEGGEDATWVIHTLVKRAVRFAYRSDGRSNELRGAALDVLNGYLSQFVNKQQPAGVVLAHARMLSQSGAGFGELNLTQLVALQDELLGAYPDAVAGWRAMLAIMEPGAALDDPGILSLRSNLAVALRKGGDPKQAAAIQREVLKSRQVKLGPQHKDTVISMDNLGVALSDLGEYEEAAHLHRAAIDAFSATLGPDNPSTLTAMANLAGVLRRSGHFSEAVTVFSDLLKRRFRVLGPFHPATLRSMSGLGETLQKAGKFADARQLLE